MLLTNGDSLFLVFVVSAGAAEEAPRKGRHHFSLHSFRNACNKEFCLLMLLAEAKNIINRPGILHLLVLQCTVQTVN
jgi:hypothetical protein